MTARTGRAWEVGGAGLSQLAVRWQGNNPVNLGTIDGILRNQATAVNAAGQIVGTADPQCVPCPAPRAWLGLYVTEVRGMLAVAGVAAGGPADRAQLKSGDLVLEVAGRRVTALAELFRSIWRLGPAGTDVPLTISRDGAASQVRVRSGDRQDFLKKPHLH